jgi:hypothetical protein
MVAHDPLSWHYRIRCAHRIELGGGGGGGRRLEEAIVVASGEGLASALVTTHYVELGLALLEDLSSATVEEVRVTVRWCGEATVAPPRLRVVSAVEGG